jgi:hypothetical protein
MAQLLEITYADGSTETVTPDVLVSRIVRAAEQHRQWLEAGREMINRLYSTLPADQMAEALRPFVDRGLIHIELHQEQR